MEKKNFAVIIVLALSAMPVALQSSAAPSPKNPLYQKGDFELDVLKKARLNLDEIQNFIKLIQVSALHGPYLWINKELYGSLFTTLLKNARPGYKPARRAAYHRT